MAIEQQYERMISGIVAHSGGADKFAHTYTGLAIWLLASLVLRRPRGSVVPLLPVIAAEIANECMDRLTHHSWRWRDTTGDMAATWFWPVVLTAVDRWMHKPQHAKGRTRPDDAGPGE